MRWLIGFSSSDICSVISLILWMSCRGIFDIFNDFQTSGGIMVSILIPLFWILNFHIQQYSWKGSVLNWLLGFSDISHHDINFISITSCVITNKKLPLMELIIYFGSSTGLFKHLFGRSVISVTYSLDSWLYESLLVGIRNCWPRIFHVFVCLCSKSQIRFCRYNYSLFWVGIGTRWKYW